jgi:hypothetical protein
MGEFATRFERAWDERIAPVLTERDPFRFVIRIQVLIEDVLKEGIDTALPAGTPGELKGLRLQARLALAEALELLTPEHVAAIRALAKIRNEFAHDLRDEFTKADADAMAAAIRPFLGDAFKVSDYSEGDAVRHAARILWQVTQDFVDYALVQREKAEITLAEYREKQALTGEQVTALLRGDEDAWEGL